MKRTNTILRDQLYNGNGGSDGSTNKYVWVDLSALNLPDNTILTTQDFKTHFLEDVNNIWFNMDVILKDTIHEDITGYMEYDKSVALLLGAVVNNNRESVGIPVTLIKNNKNVSVHPVTMTALQTMRLELPALAYPGSEPSGALDAVLKSFVGIASSVMDLFASFEKSKMILGNARTVGVTSPQQKSSWIRLANASFKKFGGGHRVKKVTLSDSWSNMASGQPNATYGQEYAYTKTQKVGFGHIEKTLTISSGVASWEPNIGSEENLWKEPVTYNDTIRAAPDNSYYVEKPFGESLFPAPMVGYSEVKVKSIGYTTNPRVGAGWSVHKYYTAREFPTIVDYSNPIRYKSKNQRLKRFFSLKVKDHLSITQGFVVEVNDMHGKPKEESTYAQNGSLIASTRYDYKVDNPANPTMHLNNLVKTVGKDGAIGAERLLGVDMEVWQDFREENSLTEGTGFSSNADGLWAGLIPIVLFLGKAILHKEDTRFRSAVTTKFVKRSGILSKVTKIQDGSTISTENLLWDQETGAVLATKTQNEFEDPIYQFNYPAHWVYDGMGMAYHNIGAKFHRLYFIDGLPYTKPNGVDALQHVNTMFTDGDEFSCRRFPNRFQYPNDTLRLTTYIIGSDIKFYTDKGTLFSSNNKSYNLILSRSGRRNMPNTSIGGIISKTNPLVYSSIQEFASNANTEIVEASGQTFRDLWHRDCDCQPGIPQDTINPYRHGMKGSWRPFETYVTHQGRSASKMVATTGVTNIKKDGVLLNFAPFWENDGTQWYQTGSPNWVLQSVNNIYDFKGNANEEANALDIKSAAYYGYQGNLNTAVAHNTAYKQGMFDGFEDYTFDVDPACDSLSNCRFLSHGKFEVYRGAGGPSTDIAHTGIYSVKISNFGGLELGATLDAPSSDYLLDQINDRNNLSA